MTHWIENYLALDWSSDGDGPTQYNCWNLFKLIQREQFNRDVSNINIPADDLKAVLKAFKQHVEYQYWKEIKAPVDGCAVVMRQSQNPCHIGVFIDIDGGGIVHSAKDMGIGFHDQSHLHSLGFQINCYYGYQG